MVVIHLRDAQFRNQALHYRFAGFPQAQLTDDLRQVTCKTCLLMLKRAERANRDK